MTYQRYASNPIDAKRTAIECLRPQRGSSTLAFSKSNKQSSQDDENKPSTSDYDGEEEGEKKEEKGRFESAALDWAERQRLDMKKGDNTFSPEGDNKKYVVVGGGWGGWGAVKTLCETQPNAKVILIDALPDPTGVSPYLSKTGKPVEAGTRGFWKDYPNINALCEQLNLDENDVFTPFTNSSFYSPDGLEATAPVFGETTVKDLLPPLPTVFNQLTEQRFPMLPSPLGQIVATSKLFERIPLTDRASMVGLLVATIDCFAGDEKVQEQYDRMSAHDLFVKFGLSKRLVDDFIRPTLLVGLFKPPEELSALVVMELLYYYALAHQDSFDVRWIKNGTVSDSLIAPLATYLQESYDMTVMGSCRVGEICLRSADENGKKQEAYKLKYTTGFGDNGIEDEIDDIDGLILALGCKGMKSVVSSSPQLAKYSVFSKAASLNGIDVISARIWFDRQVPTRTPANVFSRFDSLRGAGGTFFMLDQLQENNRALWGEGGVVEGEDVEKNLNEMEMTRGSVVACDFYNAGGLISLNENDIIDLLTKDLLPSAVARFADAKVVDWWVGKYPGTVSWFSPGSYTSRPPLEGGGNDILPNIKCAGDWVRMGEREHGAKGLCQERAYVSGIEAANSLLKSTMSKKGETFVVKNEVLPVREDEVQFKLGMEVNKNVMKFVPRFWTR